MQTASIRKTRAARPWLNTTGSVAPTAMLPFADAAAAEQRYVSQTGNQMPEWEVVVDVNVERETTTFSNWLARWREQVVLSENQGCGCCVDIWRISGPDEAKLEISSQLVGPPP